MMRTFRDAFTLIELLMVVAIMGLMGTLSVGGYRAMRRGMEERSVLRNTSQFIRNAYQRAEIDRQPTAVFFWNEVRRDESDDGATTMLVVGRAVAVRRAGRVSGKDDNCILDEFGDLSYFVGLRYDEDGNGTFDENLAKNGAKTYIYRMTPGGGSWDTCKSLASQATVEVDRSNTLKPMLACDDGATSQTKTGFNVYGYYVKDAGKWKVGDTYGFEIADMTLPNNYIFGNTFPQKISESPKDSGKSIWFYPKGMSGSGGGGTTVQISAVRPGKSGNLEAVKCGETEKPTNSN